MYRGLLVLVLLGLVSADLPVHCLKHQIVGKWKLYVGAPQLNGMGQLACGHQVPDSDKTSYRAGWDDFKSSSNVEVVLNDDYTVKHVGEDATVGKWTMVYDEGFEIKYRNTKYFAFSKYEPDGPKHAQSLCDSTLIGWYNNHDTNDRGCYYGQKFDRVDATDSLDQVSVVQPDKMSKEQLSKLSMIQLSANDDQRKHKRLSLEDHLDIVDEINNSDRKWRAVVYDHMVGKSYAELNQGAGRKRYFQGSRSHKKQGISFAQIKSSDVSDLPKSLDWSKYIKDARSQEECGSCYTIAAMAMLSARLRKQGEDVTLSVQHSLNCNYYNQGCDGGYPFLVSKWAQEEYLVEEREVPYTGVNGNCDMGKVDRATNVYSVRDYRYIGGGYGASSEREIMLELQHNGPVIMNFEPTFDFMYYKDGIYHSHDADWVASGDRPEWEKVDHSVLCYGWGEENGEKYWLLQNSWGTGWGENGNFRMRRGVDDSAIESMAEAADPLRVTKTASKSYDSAHYDLVAPNKDVSHIGFSFAQNKQNLRASDQW